MEVVEKKQDMLEVRRSPVKVSAQARSINQHYTGKRPLGRNKEDSEVETISPNQDTALEAEDDETMLADNSPVVDGKL